MARGSRSGRWSRLGTLAMVAVASVAAACGADTGVATDRADQAMPTSTAAPATTDDPPPTAPATTDGSGTASTATTPDGGSVAPWTAPLDWHEYGEGTETALFEVPVDYDDPGGDTFELFVARHLATDPEHRIGSILVNRGGPGFGSTDFALYADLIFGEELLERFDIVAWDPRGTGLSEPAIDCVDDYDHFFAGVDITPDDEAERQRIVDLAEELEQGCEERSGDLLAHVGTNDTARDMDSLRRALGEDTISYFGFSYGSELGAAWATMFPDTVRAAVLDGAADPGAEGIEDDLQQLAGFEHALSSYLAQCSDDESCPFNNDGDAEGAFDELMEQLDEHPIPSVEGRPDVDHGVALRAASQAMYSDSFWEQLSDALAAAQGGDGSGLLALYDAYYERQPDGTWGNSLEAFQTIRCMDREERLTVAESDAQAPELTAVAPRFAPNTRGTFFCTFFPPSTDPRVEITAAGAGPIVVIGTTGDPATPLASSRAMAEALEDGRMIVVTADRHGGYGVGGCADDLVHRYFVDLEAPPPETDC